MDVCGDSGDSLTPVPGLEQSSSGSGRSLKDEGGLATWFVDPEYSLRSVCLGVNGLLVSTVRKADRVSLVNYLKS